MEGNQMKMREALDDIVEIAKIALNVNSFGNNNNSELWKIIDKCKSALSTPPRNCDNYDNKTDAETGFVEETEEDDRNPLYWQLFANWLFAPAQEQKGDGDGK